MGASSKANNFTLQLLLGLLWNQDTHYICCLGPLWKQATYTLQLVLGAPLKSEYLHTTISFWTLRWSLKAEYIHISATFGGPF